MDAGNGDPSVHSSLVRDDLDAALELSGLGSKMFLTSLSSSLFCLLERFCISAASVGLCGGLLRGMARTGSQKSECG